jgi:hypothetical protein
MKWVKPTASQQKATQQHHYAITNIAVNSEKSVEHFPHSTGIIILLTTLEIKYRPQELSLIRAVIAQAALARNVLFLHTRILEHLLGMISQYTWPAGTHPITSCDC